MADENTAVVEQPVNEATQGEAGKPAGWEQIDYEALKRAGVSSAHLQVIMNRTNRLYSQVKNEQRINAQMQRDMKTILARVDQLEDSGRQREADSIKRDLKEAADRGDSTALADLTTKLASTILPPKSKEAAPASQTQEGGKEQPLTLDDLPPEIEVQLTSWAQERKDGQLVRPWVEPGHQQHTRANAALQALLADQALVARGAPAVLAELDGIMGTQAGKRSQGPGPVLESDTGAAGAAKRGQGGLTPAQKDAAARLGVPEDRYKKALGLMPRHPETGRPIARAEFE